MRTIQDLRQIMDKLLSPTGCPWDRVQTPQSIAPNALEEAHELVEALESKDVKSIKEELGDVLFQVIFQSAMAERLGQFKFDDVVEGICEKLVTRHAHVFGDVKAANEDEALASWNNMKKKEKKNSTKAIQIPLNLPALQRAQKIGSKTKDLKFDWNNAKEVFEKVTEEYNELKEAFASGDMTHTREELGDTFFVLAQLSRHLKFEAETVAREANRKFEDRFEKMLELCKVKGLDFAALSLNEKEELWKEVKTSR